MKKCINFVSKHLENWLDKLGFGMRTKLIAIFLLVKIIPLIIITAIAWHQFTVLGETLRKISVQDSAEALNASAIDNIERMTTDTAQKVADFLYARDSDILYVSKIARTEESYRNYVENKLGKMIKQGEWELAPDNKSWVRVKTPDLLEAEIEHKALDMIKEIFIQKGLNQRQPDQQPSLDRELSETQRAELRELGLTDERIDELIHISTNKENDDIVDGASFNYRLADIFDYKYISLYDEITFIDLNGSEIIKVVSDSSPKINYPMSRELKDVSKKENTYVKAETYFDKLKKLKPGEIYVSDVIGAYVGSNYLGMYAPEILKTKVPETHPNFELLKEIGQLPENQFLETAKKQAFAGKENPKGRRFEGIIRWATPVTNENGEIIGYVTLALNHDHIMEFVDHITPMHERYTEITSAYEGNYAFIWDYKCRSICHPRHNSIVGFDPETGNPQIPWLETSIYDAWQESGVENWFDFVDSNHIKPFDHQSRKKPPAPALTKAGLVGLDGRYLNNAPQCTGWMDLTKDGGSGSFYILWSGLYKLTTAGAIPYYTGQYAPSAENGYSRRGFGFVTIGAGIDDFQQPAKDTEIKLATAIDDGLFNTFTQLIITTAIIIILVVMIAIWMASYLTDNITKLIKGISRFRGGERQFRFKSLKKDEFGTLADSFDDMADSIVASVNRPLSIIDISHKIIYMNKYGLELTKKTLPEIVGTSYETNSIYPFGSKYCPITALEEGRSSEVYYSEKNDCYMQGVANYLLDKDNKKIGYIITSTDVTAMINAQKELEQAVNDANEASKHKGEFLARMSHEIRTPMNAIIGLANILQRKLEEIIHEHEHENHSYIYINEIKEVKHNIDHIETSSQHLLGLLNDILDITKIEAGKIDISEDTTEFAKLLNAVISIIKPRCEEKNIKFITSTDSFTHETFITDSLRLRQVLINLLGNAVKFTPELGVIEFKAEKKDSRDGKTLIEFTVRDSGIGIPENKIKNIFEPFEQGHEKNTRQYGGAGLGLAISRTIVRMLGGDIEVKSEMGEGSEFKFSLWLRETETEITDTEILNIEGKFTGKKALLVDDVEINRMIVVTMLETTGMVIDEAEDGVEALQKFKDSKDGDYDIIFMDILMPNMNGYECSVEIRKLERNDAKTVPIIALTANAFKDDIDMAIEKGMNAHIAKPIEMDKLIEPLIKFLGN